MIKRIRDEWLRRRDPVAYARKLGVRIGSNCRLIDVSFSSEPYLVTLGNHVSATATRFETHDGGVWVFRDEHPMIDVIRPINVGNNVFIGYGSIVMPGVTIGDNVVIGAGSVVTKDIPTNSICAGTPCRPIKSILEYKEGVFNKHLDTKGLSKEEKKGFLLRAFNIPQGG